MISDSNDGSKTLSVYDAVKSRFEPVENFDFGFKLSIIEEVSGIDKTIQQTKGKTMQTNMSRLHSPEKAKHYFEDKLAFTTGPVELERWIKSRENNLVVVDVREAEDYAKGHIPGAISLPKDQWSNPKGLSKEKTNVVYCYT